LFTRSGQNEAFVVGLVLVLQLHIKLEEVFFVFEVGNPAVQPKLLAT
jgi:hypothetical protein